MKRIFFATLLILSALSSFSQTFTLEEAQDLAQQNFPLAQQKNLIDRIFKNNSGSLSAQYLPQIQLNGQATYQSDVTKIELENLPQAMQSLSFPSPSKDQYKAFVDLSQLLYDGGTISNQKKLLEADSKVEKEKVAVEMYKIKDRVNQTYFGILLMDEQLKQTDLLQNDLQTALDKVNVMVKNGVSLISNKQNLDAEMLKVKQNREEIVTSRESLIKVLSILTGKEISGDTRFVKPELQPAQKTIRPELTLINYQIEALKVQNQQLNARNMPTLNLFLQGGYGKPALNMFKDKFEPYYIGGIRLNWRLSGFYTSSKERANLKVREQTLNIQKELFDVNRKIAETQQNSEILKLKNKLKSDEEIIALRSEIKKTSQVQLENGVITGSDFIRDANAENQARQTKALHEMQLLLAEYNLNWIKP